MPETTKHPWKIASRRERMQYLVRQFVKTEQVCIAQNDEGVLEGTAFDGKVVVPIWPDEECYKNTLGRQFADFKPKILDRAVFETDFLASIQSNEFLAVFPNAKFEYELFEPREMKSAIRFAEEHLGGGRDE